VTIDNAILDCIRRTLPLAWMKDDYFRCTEAALRHYAAKATACKAARPRRVLEIGTRAAYSLCAMHLVAPFARYLCIDGGLDADSSTALAHARDLIRMRRIDAELLVVDSHALKAVPRVDFAHVDGDHSYHGALADLRLAAEAETILADDCCNPAVFEAVQTFAAETGRHAHHFHDGLRAAALITRRRQ
jgi:predicted O-methyltransferase YrrM